MVKNKSQEQTLLIIKKSNIMKFKFIVLSLCLFAGVIVKKKWFANYTNEI